jgi:modification methylase
MKILYRLMMKTMLEYKIICGSSADVPAVPSSSQALAVSSPPYAYAKAYRRSDPDNIGNSEHDNYFEMIEPVYREVYRVLMSGRKFVLNITDLPEASSVDGRFSYYKYGMKSVELCEKIGFELEETIIWIKGRNRSGGAPGTLPYPASPMLLSNFEFCYVLRKPGETVTAPITSEEREASKMSSAFLKDVLYTSWNIHPETNIKYHIAPFPIELPKRFIRLYSFAGESVYEPFLGSGTTMLAAKQLHRSCVGCELGYDTPDGISWLDHIKKRVGWLDNNLATNEVHYEVVNSDGTKVTEIVDALGTQNLVKTMRKGALDKFGEQPLADTKPAIVTRLEEKEKEDEKLGEVWKPKNTDWKKQKELF